VDLVLANSSHIVTLGGATFPFYGAFIELIRMRERSRRESCEVSIELVLLPVHQTLPGPLEKDDGQTLNRR